MEDLVAVSIRGDAAESCAPERLHDHRPAFQAIGQPVSSRFGPDPLLLAHARSRPVTTADNRLLPLPGALGECFPEGAVRRGSSLGISAARGGVSLALALAAAVTVGDGWVAAVGLPSLGLLAAAEQGVKLERLALVPAPGDRWPVVAATLLEGMDLLLLGPPGRVRLGDARRLVARAREQGSVLAVLEPPGGRYWPEGPDLHLSVVNARWEGLGGGHGYLRSCQVEVVTTGRRAAARERRTVLLLSGPAGPGGQEDGVSWAPPGAPAALAPALVG